MGSLEIEDMTKTFSGPAKDIVAVDNLNITVEDGEFLVLVGPSGCGKSTTLRCVAGLEEITDGRILINGADMTNKKPKERDIAMVFQNYALYPHMTVHQNMGFGLKMTTSLSDDEIDQRVRKTASMMGIEDLLSKKPKELSGGQQQRVALGRAIVRDPAVFLMDEPLSNLDAKLRTTMRTELQSLQQNLDVTTIYVTHDQTEAMTMGDRIAILNQGELQQIGTPLECYHEPANQFVAGFIGSPSMNFIEVELTQNRDTDILRGQGVEYPISESLLENIPQGKTNLVLGIRPEDVRLESSQTEKTVSAEVSVMEPLGDSTHIYLDVEGRQFTADVTGGTGVMPGEQVYLMFPEDYIHLFDDKSGKTILNRQAPVEGHNVSMADVSKQPSEPADVSE
jgi:multiple sugar transport system ATP-binding protein